MDNNSKLGCPIRLKMSSFKKCMTTIAAKQVMTLTNMAIGSGDLHKRSNPVKHIWYRWVHPQKSRRKTASVYKYVFIITVLNTREICKCCYIHRYRNISTKFISIPPFQQKNQQLCPYVVSRFHLQFVIITWF